MTETVVKFDESNSFLDKCEEANKSFKDASRNSSPYSSPYGRGLGQKHQGMLSMTNNTPNQSLNPMLDTKSAASTMPTTAN